MNQPDKIMLPQRYQIKLFEQGTPQLALRDAVSVFHRWIRENSLGELLIDVADYRHVPGGPGILLVGFVSDYSYNDVGGRRGLTLIRKKPEGEDLATSLRLSVARLAAVCRLLEGEDDLKGRILFDTSEIELTLLDRLVLSGGRDSFLSVVRSVERALETSEGGAPAISCAADDVRQPLRISVRLAGNFGLEEMAALAPLPHDAEVGS